MSSKLGNTARAFAIFLSLATVTIHAEEPRIRIEPLQEINAYERFASHLCFLGNTHELITLGNDTTIRFWDANTGKRTCDTSIKLPAPMAVSLISSPSGDRFALASLAQVPATAPYRFHIWDLKQPGKPLECLGHSTPVIDMASCRTKEFFAATNIAEDNDGKHLGFSEVNLWHFRTGALLNSVDMSGLDRIQQFVTRTAFSKSGDLLACGYSLGSIRIYNSKDLTLAKELPAAAPVRTSITGGRNVVGLAVLADAKELILLRCDGFLAKYDLDSGAIIWKKTVDRNMKHFDCCEELGFFVDASSLRDFATIRSIETGKLIKRVETNSGQIRDLALSSDGTLLAIAGQRQKVDVYRLSTE